MRVDPFLYKNYWGASSADRGMESQRSDLWYADFQTASGDVAATYARFLGNTSSDVASATTTLPAYVVRNMLPQLVQSVALPALAVKTEMFRRGALPYLMPSWDEPLEPIKLVFLVDQSPTGLPTMYEFFYQWQELARVGRGSRKNGPPTSANGGYPLRQPEFRYRFDFNLNLCRGSEITPLFAPPSASAVEAQQAKQSQRRAQDALKTGGLGSAFSTLNPFTSAKTAGSSRAEVFMDVSYRIILRRCWVSSLRMSELNHSAAAGMVTVECALCPESMDWDLVQ